MQKFLKKFGVLFAALVATVCLAAFAAACTDNGDNGGNSDDEIATTTFTVVVKDENGNPVDGTTGIHDDSDENDPIEVPMNVQFCALDANDNLISCFVTYNLNADGEATVNVATLTEGVAGLDGAVKVEVHVGNVKHLGYVKGENGEYGRIAPDQFTVVYTISLVKA